MKKIDLLGYGAASVADSGPYNFATVYMILFFTTVVGLSPELAGTISAVTILADGIIGVIIGYISDNLHSRYGRRRPFLLAAAPLLAIGLMLLFTPVSFDGALRTAFYIIAGLMFWSGFSMYYTPYTALGAELTDDYNERSVLRTIARLFGIAGNFMGMVLPLAIVGVLTEKGVLESTAWFAVASLIAIASGASILITWKSTKGKELQVEQSKSKLEIRKLLVEYLQIIKLKPFKHMIVVVALFIIANTFYNSSMVFFTRYSLGLEDDVTSTVFLISIIANLVYTPIMGVCAVKFSKKNTLATAMLLSGIAAVAFYFAGIRSYTLLVVFVIIYSVSYTCFWQLINAIMYDISEVGEFHLGKRLEGSIASVYGFVLTIFTSIASQIVGWLLKFDFINETFILLPGICLIGSAIAQYIYPINEETFDKVKAALKAKQEGGEPDLTGLDKIL